MNCWLTAHELTNGNYWIERAGKELTPAAFKNLQMIAPRQGWIVIRQLTKDDCTNPSYDWESHEKYVREFEKRLRSK